MEATTFPWSLARSSAGQRASALRPAHVLPASLRRIFRAKAFSDLSYLFGSGWLLMLLQVIPGWNSKASGGASWDVRPRCCGCGFCCSSMASPASAAGQARWDGCSTLWFNAAAPSGRTIEPDELVLFLEGRLRQHYILEPEDLQRQLAAIDHTPDHDGHFRVTDFCCCVPAPC